MIAFTKSLPWSLVAQLFFLRKQSNLRDEQTIRDNIIMTRNFLEEITEMFYKLKKFTEWIKNILLVPSIEKQLVGGFRYWSNQIISNFIFFLNNVLTCS